MTVPQKRCFWDVGYTTRETEIRDKPLRCLCYFQLWAHVVWQWGQSDKKCIFLACFSMNFRLDWTVYHQTPSDCHDACYNANGKRSTFPRISVQKCSTRSGSAYKLGAETDFLRICPPQAPKILIKNINFHREFFKNTTFFSPAALLYSVSF